VHGNAGLRVKARTKNQQRMVEAIGTNDMLFAIGPAGTGKTYTAVALAVRALRDRQVRRIILTRPAVEAGESLGFLPVDLREKLDPYLQPLYDDDGVFEGFCSVETEITEELATRGHEERLERVLGHLVQNALDATPASGRVWVHAARASGQLRVEVGDTGQGMSEEFVRTRLFKPFSSTKGSGMGIGSYESAQYIRELGGSLEVDSREGHGTVLTVLLPLLEVGQAAELPVSAS